MYSIKRVNGEYLAFNSENKSEIYVVPDEVFTQLVRQGLGRNNISDKLFIEIKQRYSGIVPYQAFNNLGKKDLLDARGAVISGDKGMKIIIEKKKKDGKAVVDRKKSSLLKEMKIKTAAGIMAVIVAITGGLFLKKKLSEQANNDNSVTKTIDNDVKSTPSNTYDPYDDDNYEEENVEIIEDSNDIEHQEDNTEYYYNLDGEVDRQNYINAMKYIDEFKKAEEKFGIDHRLLIAIACQESSGLHDPNDSKYAHGIMKVQDVHKGEKAPYKDYITNKNDTIEINDENLDNVQTNIYIGAALLQHCLDLACENGYDTGILTSSEIIPIILYGYNNGPTALVKSIKAYKESGEESYNSFIRTTISTNIDNEDLVWHYKYPALVLNERNEENMEFWVKYNKDGKEKIFKTKPINESKMYSASFKR